MSIERILKSAAHALSAGKRKIVFTPTTEAFKTRAMPQAAPRVIDVPDDVLEMTGLSAEDASELHTNIAKYRRYKGLPGDEPLGIPYLRDKHEQNDWRTISQVMRRHSQDDWWSDEFRTGRSDFDQDLDILEEKHGWGSEVVVMTPDEYIDQAVRVLRRMENNPNLTREEVETTRLDSYIEIRQKMIDNPQFDIPYLKMTQENPSQEGINRAMAARDLGIDEIPVLVIRDGQPTAKQFQAGRRELVRIGIPLEKVEQLGDHDIHVLARMVRDMTDPKVIDEQIDHILKKKQESGEILDFPGDSFQAKLNRFLNQTEGEVEDIGEITQLPRDPDVVPDNVTPFPGRPGRAPTEFDDISIDEFNDTWDSLKAGGLSDEEIENIPFEDLMTLGRMVQRGMEIDEVARIARETFRPVGQDVDAVRNREILRQFREQGGRGRVPRPMKSRENQDDPMRRTRTDPRTGLRVDTGVKRAGFDPALATKRAIADIDHNINIFSEGVEKGVLDPIALSRFKGMKIEAEFFAEQLHNLGMSNEQLSRLSHEALEHHLNAWELSSLSRKGASLGDKEVLAKIEHTQSNLLTTDEYIEVLKDAEMPAPIAILKELQQRPFYETAELDKAGMSIAELADVMKEQGISMRDVIKSLMLLNDRPRQVVIVQKRMEDESVPVATRFHPENRVALRVSKNPKKR